MDAKKEKSAGRPRTFDEEKALQAAIACFWAHGYEATSVRDLSGSMGIASASLYNAYGCKRALYAAALEHYCNHSMRERIMRLEASVSGFAAIEAYFEEVIEKSVADTDRKGCLLVNAALEMAPRDERLTRAISGYFAELHAFFLRSLIAAQASGDIDERIDPRDHADHLLALVMGIRLLARCSAHRGLLEAAVNPALQRLHSSPTRQRKDCS